MSDNRQQMMQSWRTNAEAWTTVVRDRQIESRRLVTDAVILAAILSSQPKSFLDVGCGEGWLCRAVAARGIATVGIDGSAELIDRAQAEGGEFYVADYATMPDLGRKFGSIVCNFSLLERDLDDVIDRLSLRLEPAGLLSIQTVHDRAIAAEDGWQIEHFTEFGAGFSQAMPWYFRRRESWLALFTQNNLTVESIVEPCHPITQQPLSLLFQCRRATT